ncbi:hypothetical protein [Streptomyces albogriseolus]|uniref:hypothetical protein n=1 Tax=Streptomyces albogriseolus TaxID=1887 RepID=UPI003CF523B6
MTRQASPRLGVFPPGLPGRGLAGPRARRFALPRHPREVLAERRPLPVLGLRAAAA